jgi:hypothetical protein
MSINQKIGIHVLVWVVLTAFAFMYLFPFAVKGITDLQIKYAKQIIALNELRDNAKSLQRMQQDINSMEKHEVQPEQFFTSDLQLVNEIKRVEAIAAASNLTLGLSLAGTTDKAANYPSASGVSQVPLTMLLRGTFPDSIRFLKAFENSPFIAPVNGISFTKGEEGFVNMTVVSNFLIHKQTSAGGQKK